jgi:hypothetical protein
MPIDNRWSKRTMLAYERGFRDAKAEDLTIVREKLLDGSRNILFEIIDKAKMAVYPEN